MCARVLECDLEASLREGHDPKMGRRTTGKKKVYKHFIINYLTKVIKEMYNMDTELRIFHPQKTETGADETCHCECILNHL